MSAPSLFEAFLQQHDPRRWSEAIDALAPSVHPVDHAATRIWFYFFPLTLAQAIAAADQPDLLVSRLSIQGRPRLKDQIDRSHHFLFGHRYWPHVRKTIVAAATTEAAPSSLDLASLIREMARSVARQVHADESLLVGIVAVGLMTLQQVGLDALSRASGETQVGGSMARLTPDQIVARRLRDDGQGVFGFLKGIKTDFTVTFDEHDPSARFPIINRQHLTTASANDLRDYKSRDPRCFAGGPIPVECRTASCGTCWVGILGGQEKLSEVEALEGRRIREFGYIETTEVRPVIRLACMAQAAGNVTIVIPPWNGIVGKFLRGQTAAGGRTAEQQPH